MTSLVEPSVNLRVGESDKPRPQPFNLRTWSSKGVKQVTTILVGCKYKETKDVYKLLYTPQWLYVSVVRGTEYSPLNECL